MKIFKRVYQKLSPCLLLALAMIATACSGVEHKTTLKLGHGLSSSHPVHRAFEEMNKELKELSKGAMELEIYSSAQLGSENQCIELLQIGSLDITKTSAAPLEGFVEKFKIFGIPYLFHSHDHYDRFLSSAAGDELLKSTEPFWFRGLTYFDAGARSIYTTKRAVRSLADMKGLKIRVQKSPIAVEMIDAFGASATPVDWGELYTALQSNVVDGAENNTPSITTAFHHEVAKYYTVNEHNFSPDVVIISSATWAKLTLQQREWITEAARRAKVFQQKLWAQQEQESLKLMIESGVEVIYPDKSEFIEAAQPMVRRYKEDPTYSRLINQIDAVK